MKEGDAPIGHGAQRDGVEREARVVLGRVEDVLGAEPEFIVVISQSIIIQKS